MALAQGDRIGQYQITGQLGAGGMGEVYRATDTRLKREVAIKVLPADLAADAERLVRFQREAEVVASLSHPNIAAIYGFEDAGGSKALVMELVEGYTLADILDGRATPEFAPIARPGAHSIALPLNQALAVARQIAEALEAAHERGIIYRDLKPANIKVRPDGVVKVLDFGIAKAMDSAAVGGASAMTLAPTVAIPATTIEGQIIGTPAYMSPEQARGRAVDRRTDVWAFGAVLFEMLTGTRAFPGEDASQMLARVIERDPDWSRLPKDTPPRIVRAIELCLKKEPRQRPGDLSTVRLALDGAFETAAPAVDASARPTRWRPLLMATVTALIVGAVAGAVAWRASQRAPTVAAVERFMIPTPADRPVIAGTVSVPEVAISPDGSMIAYGTAIGQAPQSLQIYVRNLDALEPTVLRGTEGGGTLPFFSPDGQSIGFVNVVDNSLRRVPVTGGAAQVLGKFPTTPVGISWAPDGSILFTLSGPPAQVRGLMRLPPNGGKALPLTTVDTKSGDTAHFAASVLPGGRAAVFNIGNASGPRLAVVNLADGAVTDLKIPGVDPSYSPTGHLVYGGTDGTLNAVAFDADRRVTSGSPVTVLQNVVTRTDVAQYSIAENGSLAYIMGSSTAAQRTLVWVDRSGHKEPIAVPPRLYTNPRISPDGTRVAMVIDGDIWVTELARPGTLQRITTDPARERFPAWTRDSRRIVFETNKGGAPSIVAKSADGRGDEQTILTAMAKDLTLLSPESWSVDGRELVFIYRIGAGSFDIGRVTADGSQKWQPVLNTEASESDAAVSPDGRRIAYAASETGQREIYLEAFPGLGSRQIVSTGGGGDPVWSRDGRELFYRRSQEGGGGLMASAIQTAPVFTIGAGRELFVGRYYQVPGGSRQWDVSRDGRFLMLENVDDEASRPQIVLVRNWFEELRRLVPRN